MRRGTRSLEVAIWVFVILEAVFIGYVLWTY